MHITNIVLFAVCLMAGVSVAANAAPKILLEESFDDWSPEEGLMEPWQSREDIPGLRVSRDDERGITGLDGSGVDQETTSPLPEKYFIWTGIQPAEKAGSKLVLETDFVWGFYLSPVFFIGRIEGDFFSGYAFSMWRDGANSFMHAEIYRLEQVDISQRAVAPGAIIGLSAETAEDVLRLAPVEAGTPVDFRPRTWGHYIFEIEPSKTDGSFTIRLNSDLAEGPSFSVVDENPPIVFGDIDSVAVSAKGIGGQPLLVDSIAVSQE